MGQYGFSLRCPAKCSPVLAPTLALDVAVQLPPRPRPRNHRNEQTLTTNVRLLRWTFQKHTQTRACETDRESRAKIILQVDTRYNISLTFSCSLVARSVLGR